MFNGLLPTYWKNQINYKETEPIPLKFRVFNNCNFLSSAIEIFDLWLFAPAEIKVLNPWSKVNGRR